MLAFSLAMTFALAGAAPAPAPKTGEDVVRDIYEKYKKTWYRQLSFVQRAIFARHSNSCLTESSRGARRARRSATNSWSAPALYES